VLDDTVYCSNCKDHKSHHKKIEIYRPPPILIVQLKRFKIAGNLRQKLLTLVEFPTYNLDLSGFVTDKDFLKTQGIEQKYDLYGIINHYGSMNFGHYTSIVKSPQDGQWRKYDDSNRVFV